MKPICEILFTSKTSDELDLEYSDEYVYEYLWNVKSLIRQMIYRDGYIYLNKIYELLHIKWNPDNENIIFRNVNEDDFVYFEFGLWPHHDEYGKQDGYLIYLFY